MIKHLKPLPMKIFFCSLLHPSRSCLKYCNFLRIFLPYSLLLCCNDVQIIYYLNSEMAIFFFCSPHRPPHTHSAHRFQSLKDMFKIYISALRHYLLFYFIYFICYFEVNKEKKKV